ncbi:hypothetical protein [Actinoallomurus sp. CA-142502]|uniref:hypothetical protein n=1 Tax=Actinoallomurus sp. CA-142502 TaxID=3239885 RepID=UPI003D90AC13
MMISWTGKGWLALPIIVVTVVIGGFLAVPLSSIHALGSNAVFCTMPFAFALAAFPSYLLGRTLNSSVGADGRRVWHNRHRFGVGIPLPLQSMWVGEAAVAYLLLAVLIGGVLLNSPPVVWTLWLLLIVVGVVAVITLRRRRKNELEQVRARSRRATQAIKAGETMRFGGLSVSNAGIECDGRMLPFTEIVRIHHDRDNLYCQLHAGTYTYPLSKIHDHTVAAGVAIGFHRATTGRN